MNPWNLAKVFCLTMVCLSASGRAWATAQAREDAALPVVSTIDGRELGEEALKNKIIVLDFWATWCMPCRAAMPEIKKVHERYKDQSAVIFLGMAEENSLEKVKRYVEKNEITWSIAMDEDAIMAKRFEVKALPGLMVLDRHHQVVWQGPAEELDKALRKVIKDQD